MSDAAKVYAQELVSVLKLAAPIDLVSVATHLGLTIRYRDISSFEGALVCSKQHHVGTVLVKKSIREVGRIKFTIAHEIGHYVLPHHIGNESICAASEVENWDKRLSKPEQEANIFAGELLMPETLVGGSILRDKPSFDAIRGLATAFETSLTAAAYRSMQLTPFRAAIVWSTQGEIRWFKASSEFAAFVLVRESVASGTFASDCFHDRPVPDDMRTVRSDLWLASNSTNPGYIFEQSIRLPSYDSVLTLLLIENGRPPSSHEE
jgi:Zn-dependent peptidase ImmA (M78 family)